MATTSTLQLRTNGHSLTQRHVGSRQKELNSYDTPKLSIVDSWSLLLSRLKEATATIRTRYEERARIEKDVRARVDDWCNGLFIDELARLEHLTAELEMQLAITKTVGQSGNSQAPSALSLFFLTPWQMEERFRALVQLQSFVGSFFERASPTYDQSKTIWWFDPAYYQSNGLNYDRYGASDVKELEARILKALGLGNEKLPLKLLLTSSGVAAFTVLQQFVMSKVVTAGDTIVISPYLYFECFDHLRLLNHVKVVNAESFSAEDIIAAAEKHNAKAIYLDPMANTLGLETTDIRRFSQIVSQREGWSDRFLIIDGTLVSGGMAVYDWFDGPQYPKVLYYESAHKYIQMGMDIVMCGLLVYPEAYHETLGLIRQVTGTTLYSRQANVLPHIDFQIHQSRMHRLTTNAEKLYHLLEKQSSSGHAVFNFPVHWRRLGWSHGGNVVTIRLLGGGAHMNKRPSLDGFTSLVLRAAEEESVGMTKGGGLGFSVTRIWPSTPFIHDEDPYMRISVGVDPDEVEPVARAIIKGLERHCRASTSAMAEWKLRETGIIKTNGSHFGKFQ
ncbi:pyridoxal phosphate-dependent transferase [Xylariomycetidae sp. FL2044]|nr:pyridoxal phosphate-dependent transferase [Xylariomycetidae sp. FL2044]